MEIKTKFNIGDYVVYKNLYVFKIGGIVIFSEDNICYFEDYEEDNYEEKELQFYKENLENDK